MAGERTVELCGPKFPLAETKIAPASYALSAAVAIDPVSDSDAWSSPTSTLAHGSARWIARSVAVVFKPADESIRQLSIRTAETPRKREPLLALPDRMPALEVPWGQMSVRSKPGAFVSLQFVPPFTQSLHQSIRPGLVSIVCCAGRRCRATPSRGSSAGG